MKFYTNLDLKHGLGRNEIHGKAKASMQMPAWALTSFAVRDEYRQFASQA